MVPYLNFRYIGENNDNRVFYSGYEIKENEILRCGVEEIFKKDIVKVWENDSNKQVDIVIVGFDNSVSINEKQLLILQLWECLMNYNDAAWYFIYIMDYPEEYKRLYEQKIEQGFQRDLFFYPNEQTIHELKDNGEINHFFIYRNSWDKDNLVNLDTLLDDYKNGTYDKTIIWNYWRGEN